jgi:hypothetical protein
MALLRQPVWLASTVLKCDKAALVTAAACVRRLPLVLLKLRVMTLCSRRAHLNVVIGLVV